jgi:hypothetical protein
MTISKADLGLLSGILGGLSALGLDSATALARIGAFLAGRMTR